MKVFLLTKEDMVKVAEQIAQQVEKVGRVVTIFTNQLDFYVAIREMKPESVAFVMIDVRVFQLDVYNPYSDMLNVQNPCPVVVFNDPFPEPDKRSDYWIEKNKFYLSSVLGTSQIESFRDEFFLIESYLNSNKINPYVSVINRPEKFYTEEEKLFMIDLESFRLRHRIAPSRFKVFKLLYENLDREVSEDEILTCLHKDNKTAKRGIIFSYIHDLRKAIRNEKSAQIRIFREYKGHYVMRISPFPKTSEAKNNF
jgi:DNA-binding response OmpR family regulator